LFTASFSKGFAPFGGWSLYLRWKAPILSGSHIPFNHESKTGFWVIAVSSLLQDSAMTQTSVTSCNKQTHGFVIERELHLYRESSALIFSKGMISWRINALLYWKYTPQRDYEYGECKLFIFINIREYFDWWQDVSHTLAFCLEWFWWMCVFCSYNNFLIVYKVMR